MFAATLATGIVAGCASGPRQTVAVVTPAPAAVVAAVRPNVSGNWLAEVPNADGTARRTYFTLAQQGDRITGTVHAPTSFVQITESTWDSTGTGFTLVTVTRNGANERRATYEGKLVGDQLHVTMRRRIPPGAAPAAAANNRPMELVAHRVAPSEGAMPAKIALPARHVVKDNGIARAPAMGWNSWNKFAGRVDDASVRAMADAMASNGMKEAGYQYINIDDTWEGDARDAQGNIATTRKFPDMKALADYV
ncbi:MAG: glycoside hydrolase clan, partial [Gemmatimonadetes bacterium]|nr:glycoside hydrolase clan [Gemmatimonadota bacterium]